MQSSAAILAGGRATRFAGRDKAALLVGDRTIRARQLEVLRSLSDDVLIVGGKDPGETGARYVPDLATACGPLGGVYTALLESAHERTIVLAGDMPFVTAPLVGALVASLGDADVAVPRTARGFHPLCAVYARRTVDAIAARLRAGRLKMIELFEDVRVEIVEARALEAFGDPDRLLANVNTPADYDRLAQLESHEP